jgi:tRNA U55 pseudouridine synthase TruB
VRTLFSDIARDLGTLGTLVSLVREKIGPVDLSSAFPLMRLKSDNLISSAEIALDELLPYGAVEFPANRAKAFSNGLSVLEFQSTKLEEGTINNSLFWAYNEQQRLLGLAQLRDDRYFVKLNFPA